MADASTKAERKALGTLRLERNVARAPIWAPRAGVPLQLALAWPDVPFHQEPFHVSSLSGSLGPSDLLVFAHVCTLFIVRPRSDRQVAVSLGEVARWMGARSVGGSQRRLALECLARLRGATFTSRLRSGRRGTERLHHGWGLLDEWLMPEGGRLGWVRLSQVMAELLAAGSLVLLDARTLGALVDRSALAARLWVLLEADTLGESGLTDRGQPYPLFAAREGEPSQARARACLVDTCRLTDPRRRRAVALLRAACEIIEEEDTRYRLTIAPSASGREGMWNLWARRARRPTPMGRRSLLAELGDLRTPSDGDAVALPGQRAPWGTDEGRLGDAEGAGWGTEAGTPGDGPPVVGPTRSGGSVLRTGAPWGTVAGSPRRASPDVLPDERFQTIPSDDRRSSTTPAWDDVGRTSIDPDVHEAEEPREPHRSAIAGDRL